MWISAGVLTLAVVAAAFAWRAGRLSGPSAGAGGVRRWPTRIAAALFLPLSACFFYAWTAAEWREEEGKKKDHAI